MAGFSSVAASDMRASQHFEDRRVGGALRNELAEIRHGYPRDAGVLHDVTILRLTGAVTHTRVPKSSEEALEMNPFTEIELERAYDAWRKCDERLADVLLVMGWTGLRWGEARTLQVADFVEVPTPGLMVRRTRPERIDRRTAAQRGAHGVPSPVSKPMPMHRVVLEVSTRLA